MHADATGFASLVERYQRLRPADRKAVRRNLSPSEFEALESACIELDKARRAERAPERQFRGYSPWLTRLIEQALDDDQSRPEVTAECRAAIVGSHLSTLDDRNDETMVARFARRLGIAVANGDAEGAR